MKNYIYLCPSSTNNVSIVAGHHLNQVGSFCEMYRHEVDLVNRLRDGCNRVVQTIAKESTFFEKVRIDLFLYSVLSGRKGVIVGPCFLKKL